jgi:hypothetical protein
MRLEAGDLVILDWCLGSSYAMVIEAPVVGISSVTLVRVLRAGGRMTLVDQVTGVARVLARASETCGVVKCKS